MSLRQTLNVSFAVQAGAFTEDNELNRWLAELPVAPGGRPSAAAITRVDPALLGMMGG